MFPWAPEKHGFDDSDSASNDKTPVELAPDYDLDLPHQLAVPTREDDSTRIANDSAQENTTTIRAVVHEVVNTNPIKSFSDIPSDEESGPGTLTSSQPQQATTSDAGSSSEQRPRAANEDEVTLMNSADSEDVSNRRHSAENAPPTPKAREKGREVNSEIQNFIQQRRVSQMTARHRNRRKANKIESQGRKSIARGMMGFGGEQGDGDGGDGVLALDMGDREDQTEEELFKNIQIQKDVVKNVRFQPWSMRKKLAEVRAAKEYIHKHEGALSLGHGYQQAGYKAWQRFKRIFNEAILLLTPWEMRFKLIESHFGSVVSSYFIFIRWLVWINILLTVMTFAFILVPAVLVGDKSSPGKQIPVDEMATADDLDTLWDFEGRFKYSPLFYGWYGSAKFIGNGYRLPLAYLLAGLATYIISFVLVLRRMAENAKLNKATSDDEHYTFCWRLFTSWDCSIGSAETAKNKVAEICTIFREAVLEVQEKAKADDSKKIVLIVRRVVANILVVLVLAGSTFGIYKVVERSGELEKSAKNGERVLNWWEVNEVSIVMSAITTLYPTLFDLIGMLELYHPMINLRWQLARIFSLYLLNLGTLYIALFQKITQLVNTQAQVNATATEAQAQVWPCFNSTGNCSMTASKVSSPQESICWETMVGQEIVKLTNFDLIFTTAAVLLIDFFRGLVVRYCNICCCWDLEMKFPEYGEFKIAENILHLIYNQGMIWLGTFFSPALPAINIFKLLILLYLRSWAVLMCNIPHERVFRVSRSNNFYYFLTLVMLFLCTLPVGYAVTAITPSKDCGPFINETVMYKLLSRTIDEELPTFIVDIINYATSPGILIPFFILLIMVIYYLITLSKSLKEANTDLKAQLHYERTEEKKKVYAMADGKNARNSAESETAPPDGKTMKAAVTEQPAKRQLTAEEIEQAKLRFQYAAHLHALHLMRAQQRNLEQSAITMRNKYTKDLSKNASQ